uniref:Uncharacterized protein n=1 Tax=Ananas comosus var. bracteatus TaxID=296719 RepID=A0A6V7NF29_ANACO|nr:unnamed protein product [Ananas comosus var. bracteatus]
MLGDFVKINLGELLEKESKLFRARKGLGKLGQSKKRSAGAPVQNLHWSRNALGDRSLAMRDRSHQAGLRGSLMRPVPGSEGPVPERQLSENSRNLAKSRKPNSREPVYRTRTGLPGTGLSSKDRFPNAKSLCPRWNALGDRSPELGPVPHCENAQKEKKEKKKERKKIEEKKKKRKEKTKKKKKIIFFPLSFKLEQDWSLA